MAHIPKDNFPLKLFSSTNIINEEPKTPYSRCFHDIKPGEAYGSSSFFPFLQLHTYPKSGLHAESGLFQADINSAIFTELQ